MDISPRYQLQIIAQLNNVLFDIYKSYDDVEAYIEKWRIEYDCYGNSNFYIIYNRDELSRVERDFKNNWLNFLPPLSNL